MFSLSNRGRCSNERSCSHSVEWCVFLWPIWQHSNNRKSYLTSSSPRINFSKTILTRSWYLFRRKNMKKMEESKKKKHNQFIAKWKRAQSIQFAIDLTCDADSNEIRYSWRTGDGPNCFFFPSSLSSACRLEGAIQLASLTNSLHTSRRTPDEKERGATSRKSPLPLRSPLVFSQ